MRIVIKIQIIQHEIAIIVWTIVFLLPVFYYLFQNPHTKGISLIDLKNCFIIYIIGIITLPIFKKLANIVNR